jgi:hypothetical protein
MAVAVVLGAGFLPARAQDAAATVAAPAASPADVAFTREELRKLLAPYALFPDALLAQLLPASAYPIEIVQASRWLAKNKAAAAKGDFSGLDAQPWDPSVKALARFPDLIEKLNADLDATTDLGDAFVNQPDDVAQVIQELRREAQKAGSLKTSKQQRVTTQKQGPSQTEYIVIEPTDPDVIYVPSYDPMLVYDESYVSGSNVVSGLIGFGVGVAVGAAIDNVWDWGRGWVYPPRWPGYPNYRPGWNGNNNINIDRGDINIGSGNNVIGGGNNIVGGGNIGNGNTRPWRPDSDRYRPGQGSKPGLANPDRRPGGTAGAGTRPAPGNRPGLERPTTLPAVQPGNRPDLGKPGQRPETRPALDKAKLPDTRDIKRPDVKRPDVKKPDVKRPQAKPAPRPAPQRDTAFADAKYGGMAKQFEKRGSISREAIQRPANMPRPEINRGGGGRPQFNGGGGGGRPQLGGGGGGRPQMQRGGGGRRR